MNWIMMSIGVIISAPVMYLFIRKAKDLKKEIEIQNLSIFLIPTIVRLLFGVLPVVSDDAKTNDTVGATWQTCWDNKNVCSK